MSLYPGPVEASLQGSAEQAASAKRAALDALLRAFRGPERAGATGVWRALLDELASQTPRLSYALVADEMRQRGRRRDVAIRLLNACRFLLEQLVNPSADRWDYLADLTPALIAWVRGVQVIWQSSRTPLQEGEVVPEDSSSPSLTDEALGALADARNAEIRARQEVNRLIIDSFAGSWPDGTPCNPLLMESRRTLLRFPARTLTADDLLSEGICRLYARIDAYSISKGPFLGWWHVLVRNRLADLLRRERAVRRLDENGDERGNSDDASGPVAEDGEPKPFSAADWARIRGWADHNLLSAVVVLVGFGWLDKVQAQPTHWDELRDWLGEIGVDDVDAFQAARQATGEWTTTGQLRVLAEHAGRKPNSLSQHFHRKFRGIGQTVRQESFGKKHLAVQLDYFWQPDWLTAPALPAGLCQRLQQTGTYERVTALCCCPAWHLLGCREQWAAAHEGYPFQRVPPLLELLRRDFEIAHPHEIPPDIRHERDVQSFVREVVLAHGTQGKLAAIRQRLRRSHERCGELEAELRTVAEQTSYG